jgi:mono/diheme cytochrome c family protein
MRIILGILVVVALLMLGAAVFAYSGLYNVAASSPHNALTAWLLSTTVDASVARRAAGVEVPDLSDPELKLAGASAFDAMCAICHGAPGRERGALGRGLNPLPPELDHAATDMTPAELFWVTRNGIRFTGMPAWGPTHSDQQLWSLVAFMVELPNLDAQGYQALLSDADEADLTHQHDHDHSDGHGHGQGAADH